MEKIILRVLDFTENPGPRYIRQDKDGECTSGEAFYIHKLNAVFKQVYEEKNELILELDGVSGYPSSFLDEAIGELVYDFTLDVVSKLLFFDTVIHKRRAAQVKEFTYQEWEKRRKKKETVIHSENINASVFYINDDGIIDIKHIP